MALVGNIWVWGKSHLGDNLFNVWQTVKALVNIECARTGWRRENGIMNTPFILVERVPSLDSSDLFLMNV